MGLLTPAPLHRRSGPFLVLDFGQIQVQLQVEGVTARNLRQYLDAETARMRELLKNLPADFDKVIVVVDGSVALLPPPEARDIQAKWIAAHRELLRTLTHKIAFVVPNPWVRAIMTAVFAIAPSPVPIQPFANLDEALTWATAESRSTGGTLTAELLSEGANAVSRLRQAFAPEGAPNR